MENNEVYTVASNPRIQRSWKLRVGEFMKGWDKAIDRATLPTTMPVQKSVVEILECSSCPSLNNIK